MLESSLVRPVDPDNGLAFPRINCRPGGQDLDKDGIPDEFEAPLGCTNPLDRDSDDDGIVDGLEDADLDGVLDPGETSPCAADTDGDHVQDGTERGVTQGVTRSRRGRAAARHEPARLRSGSRPDHAARTRSTPTATTTA